MSKDAVPHLVGLLERDRDKYIQQAAARALGDIGPDAKVASAILTARLKHDEVSVRLAAAVALVRIGPPTEESIQVLLAEIKSKEGLQRLEAAYGLWFVEAHRPTALTVLLDALKSKKEGDFLAASYLGLIGPKAKDAVPTLKEMLKDRKTFYSRRLAKETLRKILPPE